MTEIGKKLQEARVDKGLTLDDLQQITKIQKRYLIAIEEDNFDDLPGQFYVRAFVRQYAETVDLDPNELLAALEPAKPEPTESEEPVTKRTQAQETETKSGSLEKLYSSLPMIIMIVLVVGILGAIWVVGWANHNKNAHTQIESSSSVSVKSDVSSSVKATKSSSSKKKSSTKKTSSKQTIKSVSSSGSSFTYDLTSSKKQNTVTVTAGTASAWTQVSANGTSTWQGTLTAGSSHTVTLPSSTTKFTIMVGNSNSTTLKINGKTFNYKAQDSSTTVRTLTINVK